MQRHSYRFFRPGDRFLIIFIAFLSAFPPIATDLYLPALPVITRAFATDETLATFSISGFLFTFAISMLIWGPLSDKFGRKPVLICGSAVFIISSMAIALANSMPSLLVWRLIQAGGSGAACAMSLALVRDVYKGRLMEKVISLIQTATIIAPMLAPVLGGAMLTFTTWRGIFWVLAALGVIALLGSCLIHESAGKSATTSITATFARIGIVLANKNFLYPLIIFSAMAMPFMSYLGTSSFIYQDYFGLSAQTFSFFFALNAAASLAGPLLHLRVLIHYDRCLIIAMHLAIIIAFGIFLLLAGHLNPWSFALLFMPITISGSALRPPSTVLMLNSIKGDTGIVTALINCGGLLFGSIAMLMASSPFWPNGITAIGIIAVTVSGVCLAAWFGISQKNRKVS